MNTVVGYPTTERVTKHVMNCFFNLSDHRSRQRTGSRAGRTVRQVGRHGGLRGRGPGQQRRDRSSGGGSGARHQGQGVHGERGGRRRGRSSSGQGGAGPGPGRSAHQQRGRHHRPHVPGSPGPHDRLDHKHQFARTLLGE